MRQVLWILFLLLFHTPGFAATREDDRPEKEMLGLMEFLREMEMIRSLDLMRQMETLERMEQTPADQNTKKNPPAKTKVR